MNKLDLPHRFLCNPVFGFVLPLQIDEKYLLVTNLNNSEKIYLPFQIFKPLVLHIESDYDTSNKLLYNSYSKK